MGIRPEHVQLKDAGEDVVFGTVDVSEMMGSEIHLHVNAAGKDIIVRAQTADLPKEQRGGFAFGTKVGFNFRADLIHMFNPETEANLI